MKKDLDEFFMYFGLLGLLIMPILSIISDGDNTDLHLGTATLASLLVLFFATFIVGYIGSKINSKK